MADENEVYVNLTYFHLNWTCPGCNNENEEEFKRADFDGLEQLDCRKCGTMLMRKGEVHWFVADDD